MTTRYGRNVCQDLADLSGRSVHGVDANRLRSRYARAVEERQAKEAEYENEFRLNVPHVARVQKLIAERLEAEASEVNAKLPVASVYDAFMRVKGHADRDKDAGLRALHGHLERMWKKNRTGSITAEQYLILHDHYKRNFPRSAAAAVIEQIGQEGYTTLPLSDLTRIASDIHTQEDFDRAMVYHGLNGPLPHQVKSRRFVLGLINEVDSGERYLLEGMDFGPSFCGEDGDEAGRPFEGEDSVPQQKVRTRGPKAQRNAQMLSGGIEELERVLDGVVIDEVESGAWINPSDPEAPLHVGIVWTQSGYIGGEGVVYITEGGSHPDVALQGADEIWTENLYNNQEMRQRAEEDARDELRQDRSLLEGEPSDEEVWELADQYLSEKFAGGVWTVTVGELLGLLDSSTESWAAQIRSALGEFEGDEEGAEYARSLRERGGLRKAQQTPAFDSTAVARVGGDTYLSLNDDPVYVGVVHDSSGFTPSSAVWIQQGWGSEDTALQEAFAELEDWDADRLSPEEMDERWKTEEQDGYDPLTEGYDGFAFTTTAGELRQMIEDIQNQYNKEKFLSIEFEEDEEDARPFEGSPSARRQAQAGVDSFTEAYIEAAIWSSMDESDESGGRPIDENYGPEDLSSEALSAMSDDCRRFQADNEADLDEYESVVATGPEWTPSEQAGHDFWLTRNGHGAGFWSRDVGEVGDRLSKAAEQFGEQYLYVGDDGKLYVM